MVTDMVLEPRFALGDFMRNTFRNPAVALTQKPDKIGTTAVDLFKTDWQNLTLGRLFFGDPPAKVHLGKGYETVGTQVSEFRKYLFLQEVPAPVSCL